MSAAAGSATSSVIEHEALDLVGDILEAVDHAFQVAVDLAPNDEAHRVGTPVRRLEQPLQPGVVDLVGVTFQLHQPGGQLQDAAGIVADRSQQRHRVGRYPRRLDDDAAHVAHLRLELIEFEQGDRLGGAVHLGDRIVHHDAGHLLVAYLLGIPVTGYTLSAWEAWKQGQPGQGGVSFDDGELASQLEVGKISAQMLDRYCTVWMAGIAAETLVFNNAEGGSDDKNKLIGVLTILGFSESVYQQKLRFHILQAKTLLEENWSSYEALVNAMRQRASVEDCHAELGVGSGE